MRTAAGSMVVKLQNRDKASAGISTARLGAAKEQVEPAADVGTTGGGAGGGSAGLASSARRRRRRTQGGGTAAATPTPEGNGSSRSARRRRRRREAPARLSVAASGEKAAGVQTLELEGSVLVGDLAELGGGVAVSQEGLACLLSSSATAPAGALAQAPRVEPPSGAPGVFRYGDEDMENEAGTSVATSGARREKMLYWCVCGFSQPLSLKLRCKGCNWQYKALGSVMA